jgi:hypothetical protein
MRPSRARFHSHFNLYRRAVAETRRGQLNLAPTICRFSSSVQCDHAQVAVVFRRKTSGVGV